MQLYFKKYGSDGNPIIILHGLFGMSDNWHNIARSLSEQNVVYTIDLRNHGQSPHALVMNFSVMADDIWEVMRAENLQSATFIGHSMGGKVAMTFCNKYPEKTKTLIVVDIAPKEYTPGHQKYFDAMKLINFSASTRKEIEEQLSESIPERGEMLFLLKNLYRKDNGNFALKLNLDAIEKSYSEITKAIDFSTVLITPAFFIRGEYSNYISTEDEVEIKKHYSNVSFITVPVSGHWVHADNPLYFIDIITEFINSH